MRHRKDHRKLSRTHEHRRALLRNLVTALFQYERIETTVAKAKEAHPELVSARASLDAATASRRAAAMEAIVPPAVAP